MTLANGHKCATRDPGDVHGHGFARVGRVYSDVFWGEPKSIYANPRGLSPEDHGGVQGDDKAEPLVGVRVVAGKGSHWVPMSTHAEEDVNACSNQAGCYQLRPEVRDGFLSAFILMIFQSKNDLGCVLEVFN